MNAAAKPSPVGFIIVYTYWIDEHCPNLHLVDL